MSNHPPSEKILELSELAGGLAHEIRNPLSTLKVNLQLLDEEIANHSDQELQDANWRRRTKQRLGTLQGEVDRLQKLLDNFLKLVSHHDISTRQVDLNHTLESVIDFYSPQASQHHIRLRVKWSDKPLICRIDELLLKQAILNLLINSQQAMSTGGELILTSAIDDSMARIDIVDNGGGIDPTIVNRIFSPFFSTKKDGSGLGLSITRRIIQEHGGTITVHSEPGKGTQFTILLPLAITHS